MGFGSDMNWKREFGNQSFKGSFARKRAIGHEKRCEERKCEWMREEKEEKKKELLQGRKKTIKTRNRKPEKRKETVKNHKSGFEK